MLPTWVEQQKVVRVVVDRIEEQLRGRSGDIEKLLAEREHIVNFYDQKYDALVRCLAHEQEKAVASGQEKKRELDRSTTEEYACTYELIAQQKTNKNLCEVLDVTVTQLENVQSEMLSLQGLSSGEPQPWGTGAQGALELMQARRSIEAQLEEKEQATNEWNATQAAFLKAEDDLERQRSHAAQLEDFIQRIAAGKSGYQLDPAAKKEAAGILAAAGKLHAARLQRPNLAGGARSTRALEHAEAEREPFLGRSCAHCDEYDVRWPPPGVEVRSGVGAHSSSQGPSLHSRLLQAV